MFSVYHGQEHSRSTQYIATKLCNRSDFHQQGQETEERILLDGFVVFIILFIRSSSPVMMQATFRLGLDFSGNFLSKCSYKHTTRSTSIS